MLRHHKREKRDVQPKGFYVEAGAGDGEIISNSLYFELKYKVSKKIYNHLEVYPRILFNNE